MLLTGLAALSGLEQDALSRLITQIGIPDLKECLFLEKTSVNRIAGWRARVSLETQVLHRSHGEIQKMIQNSQMTPMAKQFASTAFSRLAEVESAVHQISLEEVEFHEVGALDSILDICLSSMLFDYIAPSRFICSPIPIGDGTVRCAHGLLSTPAPAVLELLKDVPVYGVDSNGETVTPTAMALLGAFKTEYGAWPKMVIHEVKRVYGTRVLKNLPNGAIFALGTPHSFS